MEAVPLEKIVQAVPEAAFVGVADSRADVALSGITFDSRKVKPGYLFIAVPGEKFDGHDYVPLAIESGAAAVVVQADRAERFANVTIPVLSVPDSRKAMAPLAVAFYDNPTSKLHLVGVTGTNGKTTTALMMESIARAAGDKTCYVGTLGFGINGEIVEGERTTPEAIDLQAFLSDCVAQGVTAASIEVASHALSLGRTDGCLFDVAVFTNLTQDHLDYHVTMESYRDAKGILFTDYAEAAFAAGKNYCAVLNRSDEAGLYYEARLAETIPASVAPEPAIGYVVEPSGTDSHPPTPSLASERGGASLNGSDSPTLFRLRERVTSLSESGESASIRPIDVELFVDKIRYTARTFQGDIPVELGFGGTFNVENSLAAVGYGVARGLSPEVIAEGLRTCPPVPGRFQPVRAGQDFAVLVDYAHTPDGLENVLKSARPLTSGCLIAVFGCGGNRDKTKRPKMGKLALDLADIAVVTSDNPRREEPESILDDILAGMTGEGAQIHRDADRRAAIAWAVSQAKAGDTVVIAGKGHETYQIIGEQTFPFDDVAVAGEEIKKCLKA